MVKIFLRRAILIILNLSMIKSLIKSRLTQKALGVFPRQLQMFVLQVIDEPINVLIEKEGIAFSLETSWQDDHFASAVCQGLADWEEFPLRNWIALCSQAPRDSLIIDVGAYLGVYSILAGKISRGTRVLAFEPNPAAYKRLLRNLTLNSFNESEVEVFDIALGSEALELPLSTPSGRNQSSGAKLLELGEELPQGWEAAESVSVRPLSDLMSQFFQGKRVFAVKIDAEGFELEVLKGAKELIGEHRPTIQVELLTKDSFDAVSKFLSELGYKVAINIDGELEAKTNFQFAR